MTEIPINNAEVLASLVSIPVVIALSLMVNTMFEIPSRWRPAINLAVAEVTQLFACWILQTDWRIAIAKGVLVALVASGFYSNTKAMVRG